MEGGSRYARVAVGRRSMSHVSIAMNWSRVLDARFREPFVRSSQLLLTSRQVRRVDPEQTNRSSNHGRAQRRPSAICRAAHGAQALEM